MGGGGGGGGEGEGGKEGERGEGGREVGSTLGNAVQLHMDGSVHYFFKCMATIT